MGGLGRGGVGGHALVVETALAPAEDGALDAALVAFAVFLQALGLLALAAFLDGLRLDPQTEPLGLGQVLALLVDEAVNVAGEGVDDGLLVLFLVGSVVPAGVAVAGLGAEQLLLEALAVELEAAGAFAVAAELLVRHRCLLRLLLIY